MKAALASPRLKTWNCSKLSTDRAGGLESMSGQGKRQQKAAFSIVMLQKPQLEPYVWLANSPCPLLQICYLRSCSIVSSWAFWSNLNCFSAESGTSGYSFLNLSQLKMYGESGRTSIDGSIV